MIIIALVGLVGCANVELRLIISEVQVTLKNVATFSFEAGKPTL